jgi:hypothetical protein
MRTVHQDLRSDYWGITTVRGAATGGDGRHPGEDNA